MTAQKKVTIAVQLLEEGTATARPTEAIALENGFFKVLPTPDYDPEDEIWEFLPGSIVRCEHVQHPYFGDVFLAIEKVG